MSSVSTEAPREADLVHGVFSSVRATTPQGKRLSPLPLPLAFQQMQRCFSTPARRSLEFVRALPADLQTCIITGSPDIAAAALDHPCCEVILLGGSLNRMTRSAIGQSTLAEVQSMRVDFCVLGACAVDEALMLRAENYDDARMKLALGQACNEIMLLATSEKLVKQGSLRDWPDIASYPHLSRTGLPTGRSLSG